MANIEILVTTSQPIYEFDLNSLRERMKRINFYGTTEILWQAGEIVIIHESRSYKPKDFDALAG